MSTSTEEIKDEVDLFFGASETRQCTVKDVYDSFDTSMALYVFQQEPNNHCRGEQQRNHPCKCQLVGRCKRKTFALCLLLLTLTAGYRKRNTHSFVGSAIRMSRGGRHVVQIHCSGPVRCAIDSSFGLARLYMQDPRFELL
jgi:hypothetical protein